ncbi:MAG TPA: hypothetical protein VLY24_21035 [Bryobacteraceae bacterium]|nr:hypothetical protein [Bryobacteraceae bacterium]
MAQQLTKLFEFARTVGGPTASMRLAMKTMISADRAATAPDTPESLTKVRAAIREITGKDAPTV